MSGESERERRLVLGHHCPVISHVLQAIKVGCASVNILLKDMTLNSRDSYFFSFKTRINMSELFLKYGDSVPRQGDFFLHYK